MNTFTSFQETEYGYTIAADVAWIGPDLLIVITGGDHPHIGAVTTAPPSAAVASFQFPSHDGRLHKDNFLSERMQRRLSELSTGNLTILAGLHVDHISKEQLANAGKMTDRLTQQIATWLAAHPADTTPPKYYSNDEQPE